MEEGCASSFILLFRFDAPQLRRVLRGAAPSVQLRPARSCAPRTAASRAQLRPARSCVPAPQKLSVAVHVLQSSEAVPLLHVRENTPGADCVQAPVGSPTS